MDIKELEEYSEKLQIEAYSLTKSIEALLYRVLPSDTDLEDDYTGGLLKVVSNQSRLVTDMATTLNTELDKIDTKPE